MSAVASLPAASHGASSPDTKSHVSTPTAPAEEETDANQNDGPLLLPPSTSGDGVRQISLGESLSFEELGPIIINPDGTTRRIANWANLTKAEQESSWRLISARNRRRIAALEKQKKLEEQSGSPVQTGETAGSDTNGVEGPPASSSSGSSSATENGAEGDL
jgi:hypothetical protein